MLKDYRTWLKVNHKVHLSYRDVLLVPYDDDFCSVLSRNDPDISAEICPRKKISIPIISSPMDSVTGPDMAIALSKIGSLGILTRYINDPNEIDKQVKNVKEVKRRNPNYWIACAIGVKTDVYEHTKQLCDAGLNIVCLDIANGNHVYMQKALAQIIKLKDEYDLSIIAGNVASGKAALRLAESGASSVKIGIGCFVAGSLVLTKKGLKRIEDIDENDMVLTHTNKFKKVLKTIKREEKKEIFKINNIKCTYNHKFYVLNKRYKDIVNDNTIHEYAQWIEASNLSKDYFLIRTKG